MKNFFTGNKRLKMLALLLALLAWFYVHSVPYNNIWEPNLGFNRREMQMPIEYQNLPSNLQVRQSTSMVELTMTERIRTFIADRPIRAFVDMSGISSAGRYFLEIQVEVPAWVKIVRQDPKYALIIIEEVNK